MPRFVILEHDHPFLHWDLMLEDAGRLRTWRLAAPPVAEAAISAEALADHRLAYLDYEGPVSGNRGQVARWDIGEFEASELTDELGYGKLNGDRCRGTFTLRRLSEEWWEFHWSAGPGNECDGE